MSGRVMQWAAIFFIGALLGGAGVNALLGGQVDRLYLANVSLQERLAATEKELEQVKEGLKKRQAQVISALEVHVLPSPDKETTEYDQAKVQLYVENKVREWLQPVLGQDFNTINHLLIPKVIDNREVEVDGRKYILKVNLVVVGERTIIYLAAVPGKNETKKIVFLGPGFLL